MKITVFSHPFAPAAPQVFEADNLAQWLLAHYGPEPGVAVAIYAGQPSAATDITGNIEAILAGDAPEYTILQSPGDPVSWAWYTWVAIAAAVTVVAMALIPKPVMPGNVNRTQQSPNNALGNRENQVRLLERVEDIYGTVKSIPSLMMPTYTKYINHEQYEFGYYCVGRGYHDVTDIKDGDTLVSGIGGASAAVYAPFTSPNSGHAPQLLVGDAIIDDILTVSRANEVNGITLKAPNQVTPPAGASYTFGKVGSYNRITQTSGDKPNFNSLGWSVGDDVTVASAPGATWAEGTWVIQDIGDGWLDLTASAWTTTPTASTADVYSPDNTHGADWVTLPDPDRTEVWFNITAPNGIFQDGGGGKAYWSVLFMWVIETLTPALVPTGTLYSGFALLDGATSDLRAMTLEVIGATGPIRCQLIRFTNFDFAFGGTLVDEIKWADCYSVSPVTKTEFGNKTTIHTVTRATPRATAVKTRQLNCMASRKLPTYNGSAWSATLNADGSLASGTLNATSKLVDIIAAVSIDPKIGARNISEIDLAQIWATQQTLDAWNTACGQFNFTLDSDNLSYEETLLLIANAGFCIPYRQNGKVRLALDKAQTASSALFTHRNKKPNSESITRAFASDADHDGVKFVYVDEDSQQSETIQLPLSGTATKYKKFEIAGIRNFAQAWYRANREYAKLLGQRVTIETTTTLDARSLLPNARIDVVDNTRFKSYDGEVIGQSGLTLTLSNDVVFLPATAHSIVLMKRDGSLQSIACTAGAAANEVVLAGAPSEAIVTTHGSGGIRTIYSFAADSARAAQAYLVQELDITDSQYVTLRAVNYSSDYYAADIVAVPAKAPIIN